MLFLQIERVEMKLALKTYILFVWFCVGGKIVVWMFLNYYNSKMPNVSIRFASPLTCFNFLKKITDFIHLDWGGGEGLTPSSVRECRMVARVLLQLQSISANFSLQYSALLCEVQKFISELLCSFVNKGCDWPRNSKRQIKCLFYKTLANSEMNF